MREGSGDDATSGGGGIGSGGALLRVRDRSGRVGARPSRFSDALGRAGAVSSQLKNRLLERIANSIRKASNDPKIRIMWQSLG